MKRQKNLRKATQIGLAAITALALSGCVKMDFDLSLNDDNTASGSIIQAYDKEFLEQNDVGEEELETEWDAAKEDLPDNVEIKDYDQDGYVGKEFVYENQSIDEMEDDFLTITRDGDDYVVEGELDATEVDPDTPMFEPFADSFDVRVSITFPGGVDEHNGDKSGNTVTWTAEPGENVDMSARGGAEGGLSFLLIGGIILGIVILAVIVVLVLVLNSRKKQQPAYPGAAPAGSGATPGPAPAQGYPQAGGQQGYQQPGQPQGYEQQPPPPAPQGYSQPPAQNPQSSTGEGKTPGNAVNPENPTDNS